MVKFETETCVRLHEAGLIDIVNNGRVFAEPALNYFMALGRPAWQVKRWQLTDLLVADGNAGLKDDAN